MRPTIADTMLEIAFALSARATCPKLSVGCVLIDEYSRILGTGYNGAPRHLPHCTEHPCAGATAPRGADLCEAVHAEQNALLNCTDPLKIKVAYITHAPCMRCTKVLLNTSCEYIIFANRSQEEPAAKSLWERAGRRWICWPTGLTTPFLVGS